MISPNLNTILSDIGFSVGKQHIGNLPPHKSSSDIMCHYKEVHNGKGIIGVVEHKSLILEKGAAKLPGDYIAGANWYTSSCTAFYAHREGTTWKCIAWLYDLHDTMEVIGASMHLLHKPILLNMTPRQWVFKMGTQKPAGTEPPCWKDVLSSRHRQWWGGSFCLSLIGELDAAYSLGTHCKWGTSLEQLTGCSTIPHSEEHHNHHKIDYTDYEYNRKMSK